MMGHHFYSPVDGSFMAFGMLFSWVFNILFIVLILYAIYRLFENRNIPDTKSRSLEILKERYARGEISGEQFSIMKNDLK
jgi:putative membrane protein